MRKQSDQMINDKHNDDNDNDNDQDIQQIKDDKTIELLDELVQKHNDISIRGLNGTQKTINVGQNITIQDITDNNNGGNTQNSPPSISTNSPIPTNSNRFGSALILLNICHLIPDNYKFIGDLFICIYLYVFIYIYLYVFIEFLWT